MDKNQKKNTSLNQPQADANEVDFESDLEISDDEDGGTRINGIRIPPPIKPYCSTQSKGPRLIIRYIENYFFKSYAGTVKVGPFHHVSLYYFTIVCYDFNDHCLILEILCCNWTKWKWKIECNRFNVVCIWLPRKSTSFKETFCIDS
jgi:hypothetical protein